MSVLINAYSTLRKLPAIRFPHDLHGQRSLPDPELSEHLNGFIGYVLPDTPEGMTTARYHIWCHLKRVRHHVSLTVADDQLAADDTAADRQELDRVRRAIATLPSNLKEPLVLRTIEGLSQAETAEVLGISQKAVETRLYRARARLLEKLNAVQGVGRRDA